MLKSLLYFLRFFLFWLLFFCIDRLTFLLINVKKIATVPFMEIVATFYKALKLDLSMISYMVVAPLLFYLGWLFIAQRTTQVKWLSIYNRMLIVAFSLIAVFNFNIYREWGSKINAKAIGFAISTPNEAIASSASSPIVLSLLVLAFLIFSGLFLDRRIMVYTFPYESGSLWGKVALVLILPVFTFLLIRGGFGGSPIRQSMAYFSKEQLLNHAAVNTEWNLLSSVIAARAVNSNPYLYVSRKNTDQDISNLYTSAKDSTISILNTKRPNIVLIIMESFTADLTKTLGDMDGVTPNFDSLVHKGVLFTNVYSSGSRTDKGLIATMAGFPTLSAGSIVKWPEKMQKLPAISESLYKNGYHTSFFYGGESEFDNYKAFILSHDYQKLVDRNDFKGDQVTSWGQFDDAVLTRQANDLGQEKQPFFSTLLTLTNHEPYIVPGTYRFGKADNTAKFKSTAYFTDSCINAYLNYAKKQAWYKNTLFVFIADHGHLLPKNTHDISVPQRYHVPLFFYGEVIKKEYRGKKFNDVGSQADVAATLLGQLDISAKDFSWSKNLLNPYCKKFAFFSWDNGMGFINNEQCVTFDNVGKMILYNSNPKDSKQTASILAIEKSYLQKVYQQFIEL